MATVLRYKVMVQHQRLPLEMEVLALVREVQYFFMPMTFQQQILQSRVVMEEI